MTKFIEWLEQDIARGRKITLVGIIGTFLLSYAVVLILVALGKDVQAFHQYFVAMIPVVLTIIGFYTTTSPKEREALQAGLKATVKDVTKKIK